MNKAEDRAKEAYPLRDAEHVYDEERVIEAREYFVEGYHQAEKDLALTWDDIQNIRNIISEMMVESYTGSSSWSTHEEFSKEVLKRFKDFKERKEK